MSPLTINSELGVDLNLHEGPEMVMVQTTVAPPTIILMLFYHPGNNFKVFQYTLSELDFSYVPLLANIN